MASFRVEYPAAQRLNLVEDLFGHQVADPYRWLEDADSPQATEWLAAEESLWAGYRDGLPDRESFAARVRELLRVGSVGLPAWRGTTQFYTRRDPDQEHAVLYVAGAASGADAGSGGDAAGLDAAAATSDAEAGSGGDDAASGAKAAASGAEAGSGGDAAGSGAESGAGADGAERALIDLVAID